MSSPIPSWLRMDHVFHPSDFSPLSEPALLHAVRLACVAEAELSLMYVGDEKPQRDPFPDVQAILQRWQSQTQPAIHWLRASGADPVESCLRSLERRPANLIVLAPQPHEGRTAWFRRSKAERLAGQSGEMTLFVPQGVRGFVSGEDGSVMLKNILVPVAREPSPAPAIEAARRVMLFASQAAGAATVLHVGDASDVPPLELPNVPGWTWERVVRQGDPTAMILETANQQGADLIAMTTAGRHGFLDALRGTTTETVLREAGCPLLAMPVGSFLG